MAGGVVRSLITRILFKSDPSGLKTVKTHAAQAKREMRAAGRAAFTLKRRLRAVGQDLRNWAIGLGVGGFAIKKLIDGFAKGADESAKFARGLGISAQAYQGMTHAAALSGISVQELNVALPKLAQNAGNAADGSKASALAFRRAGVDIKDASGKFKDPTRLMLDLADSFKEGRIQGNRTQVLMNLFGRSGKKMGTLLAQGSAGIKKAMVEAKRLGIVMSTKQLKAAEDYNDAMLRAKSVLLGVRNTIALHLIPSITDALDKFKAWALEGDNLKKALDRLRMAGKALIVVLALIAAAKVGQTLASLVAVTKKAIFWTRIMGRATLMAYAPYIALAAAIAAVALIIESLVVWSKGGKSAVGDLIEKFGLADGARKVMQALGKAWKAFVAILPDVLKHLLRVADALKRVFVALWDEFGDDLIELGAAIVALWKEVYPEIVSIAQTGTEMLIELIAVLGKSWREDIKPAVKEVASALSDLWVTAKPIIDWLVKANKEWLAILWQFILEAIPILGSMVSRTFKAISLAIKASITSLTIFIKGVTAAISGIKKAINYTLKLLGLQGNTDLGATISKAGVRPNGGTKAAGVGQQNNTLSVGTLSVAVQGTANMTQAEFEAAVRAGATGALQDEINNVFSGIRSVVPT